MRHMIFNFIKFSIYTTKSYKMLLMENTHVYKYQL